MTEPQKPSGPTTAQTLIALGVATALVGGGGGFLGYAVLSLPGGTSAPPASAPPNAAASHDAHGSGHEKSDAPHDDALTVKELPPIVANLAGDGGQWVRLQAAIVYAPSDIAHPDHLIAALMADISAFLRTLDVASLEGPDGLRRLQEELSERAAIRSERKLREFIVETMVVQ